MRSHEWMVVRASSYQALTSYARKWRYDNIIFILYNKRAVVVSCIRTRSN